MSDTITRAPAPSRAVNTMVLGMGMLSIPVQIFSGTQEIAVMRSEYTADGRKVGRLPYVKNTDPPEIISHDAIVKMVETDHGLVALDDWEVDEIVDIPKGTLEVAGFVDVAHLFAGRYVPNAVYQIRPAKLGSGRTAKPNPSGQAAFSLLMKGLARTQRFACVRYSLRGKPRFGALLSNGRMYSLYFDQEVREDLPLVKAEHAPRELELIEQLIEANTPSEPPPLLDRFSEAIRDYLNKKGASGEALIQPPPPDDLHVAPTTDLLSILEQSIESRKAGESA